MHYGRKTFRSFVPFDEDVIIGFGGWAGATLNPLASPAATCEQLAQRWPKLEKLSPEEASTFADDLEEAYSNLPPLRPAWD